MPLGGSGVTVTVAHCQLQPARPVWTNIPPCLTEDLCRDARWKGRAFNRLQMFSRGQDSCETARVCMHLTIAAGPASCFGHT